MVCLQKIRNKQLHTLDHITLGYLRICTVVGRQVEAQLRREMCLRTRVQRWQEKLAPPFQRPASEVVWTHAAKVLVDISPQTHVDQALDPHLHPYHGSERSTSTWRQRLGWWQLARSDNQGWSHLFLSPKNEKSTMGQTSPHIARQMDERKDKKRWWLKSGERRGLMLYEKQRKTKKSTMHISCGFRTMCRSGCISGRIGPQWAAGENIIWVAGHDPYGNAKLDIESVTGKWALEWHSVNEDSDPFGLHSAREGLTWKFWRKCTALPCWRFTRPHQQRRVLEDRLLAGRCSTSSISKQKLLACDSPGGEAGLGSCGLWSPHQRAWRWRSLGRVEACWLDAYMLQGRRRSNNYYYYYYYY